MVRRKRKQRLHREWRLKRWAVADVYGSKSGWSLRFYGEPGQRCSPGINHIQERFREITFGAQLEVVRESDTMIICRMPIGLPKHYRDSLLRWLNA